MTEQQHDDDQRAYFQQVAEDESTQVPLNDRSVTQPDDTDVRPGRVPVADQAGEASPTGTVGQREYAAGEGSAAST